MERCPNCGNKLSKIDVLCPRCGSVVEVIQIKGNISVASEAVAHGKSIDNKPVQKKEFPQNFIVYNEDFPTEDIGDIEPALTPDIPFSGISENAVVTDLSSVSDNDADFSLDQGPVNSIQAKLLEMESSEEGNPLNEDITSSAEKEAPISADEEDNDYSSRYLEKIKNLNLPEIEDINNFDPEEYMREYKYRKIVGKQSETDSIAATPANKKWLEIEEADPLASDLEEVKENVQMQEQPSEEPVQQPAERRYRGEQEKRTVNKKDISTERKAPAVRHKKRVKYSALSTFLFWIIVSAAILFSCIFFDSYVKSSFGTYDSFIYSITNGQIDIDPDKP